MGRYKFISVFFFAALLFFITSPSVAAYDVKADLKSMSTTERGVLEKLFTERQKIINLKAEQTEIRTNVSNLKRDIMELESSLKLVEYEYDKKLEIVREVLTSYQRNGSGTILKLLIESGDMSDFINTLTIFREYSNSYERVMIELNFDRENMLNKKEQLNDKTERLLAYNQDIEKNIKELEEAIMESENNLNMLGSDRNLYENRLDFIERSMTELEEILRIFTNEFNNMISTGFFPYEYIKEDISFKGIRGIIEENDFNNLLKFENVPQIKIAFNNGYVDVISDEYNLYAKGYFQVVDNTKIKFVGTEGTFYGLKLEKNTIDRLLSKGYLKFDFKRLLEGNTMKKVEVRKGFLDIYVNLKLF